MSTKSLFLGRIETQVILEKKKDFVEIKLFFNVVVFIFDNQIVSSICGYNLKIGIQGAH